MMHGSGRAFGRRVAFWALLALAIGGCNSIAPRRSPGEKLYRKYCGDCHGIDAGGHTVRSMGHPYANLRDDMWKHGGDAPGLERTIREELVFQHPSFQQISGQELRQIVDHVLALRGENRR